MSTSRIAACDRDGLASGRRTRPPNQKTGEECVLQRAERATVRMMCGVQLRDRKISNQLMSIVGINEDIVTLVRKSRLRWYRHLMRRDEGAGIRRVLEFEVAGRGRPRVRWIEQVEKDMVKAGLRRDNLQERRAW
jgi:hypothetical protein